ANLFSSACIAHRARADDSNLRRAFAKASVLLETRARSRDRFRLERARLVDAFSQSSDRRPFIDRTKQTVPPLREEKQDGVGSDIDGGDQAVSWVLGRLRLPSRQGLCPWTPQIT